MSGNDLKNKHKGERAFFVGNGPSLSNTPLQKLNNEWTFATNKINKIYSSTEWRPDYYTYFHTKKYLDETEQSLILQNIEENVICFVPDVFIDDVPENDLVHFLKTEFRKDHRIECLRHPDVPVDAHNLWSDNIKNKIYFYNNSIYPIFQIVHYMGFDELYLIGCDLGIDTDWYPVFEDASDPLEYSYRKNTYNGLKAKKYADFLFSSNKKLKSGINGLACKYPTVFEWVLDNDSHFTSDYSSSSRIKRGTDAAQRRAHKLGESKLEERGVEVFNATIGGELEIYPRVDIEQLVS